MNDYLPLPLKTDFTTELKCAPFLGIFLCWRPPNPPPPLLQGQHPIPAENLLPNHLFFRGLCKKCTVTNFPCSLDFPQLSNCRLTINCKNYCWPWKKRHPNCLQAHNSFTQSGTKRDINRQKHRKDSRCKLS